MLDSEQKTDVIVQRLCSEIQLFDLCDLDSCKQKSGRFCTDTVLLSRFEKIAENELRSPERYISGDIDDEAGDGDGYDEDDEFAVDDLDGNEDGDWEEE